MTGLPDGFSVELYLGGSWVDVTTWHVGERSTSLHVGRSTEYGDISPGTLSFSLRNEDGRFTPRSPISPYYPDLTPDVPVRVRVTDSATTYDVFTGKVTAFQPVWPNRGQLAGGTVQVSAVDALADLAGTTLDDRWTEEARALARTAASWVDIPVLAGDASASGLDNVGLTSGTLGVATIDVPTTGAGSASFGAPSGLILARSLTLSPSDGRGPLLRLAVQDDPATIDFWVAVDDGDLTRDQVVAVLYDAGATPIGSLWLEPNAGPGLDLVVRTGVVTATRTLVTDVQDGAWRHVSLAPAVSPTSTTIAVTGATTVTAAWDMRDTRTIRWGGQIGHYDSAAVRLAGPLVSGGSAAIPSARGLTGQTALASATFAALQSYVPTVTSWATRGAEDRTIGEPSWHGKTAAAVLQQLARTVNGIGWCRGDGAVELIMGDVARPATPSDTLDTEADLDADGAAPTFRDAVAANPTRVRITYATGAVTKVDATAETAGRRVEAEVDTCAADQTAALFAGDYVLRANNALRVSQVAVDLYSSAQDLWPVMLGRLFPTQLLRLDGWPAEMAGDVTLDVHVQGWDLDISESAWRYVLDCSPAGLFPSATWDGGDDYGRWTFTTATVTGGTAVGSLLNGTIEITFADGVGLTLDPADYPLFLDWDGEQVEISAPPGGASSPQTVTTTERGVGVTTAQIHLSGESVEIWHGAVFGF